MTLQNRGADFLDSLQTEAERSDGKASLPSAMFLKAELKEKLQDHRLLLLLDYDGTLTPIVRRRAVQKQLNGLNR